MAKRHVIELAFDLSRMPALARSPALPQIPPDIIELMRIAAASPGACEAAAAKTGEPTAVVMEAARFYLQHVLFRPEADCYRILGLEPNASRATARSHMRLLLQWLHPDRNQNGWDAIYAERVLKAWREVSTSEVSASNGSPAEPSYSLKRAAFNKRQRFRAIRLPWIEYSAKTPSLAIGNTNRVIMIWAMRVGLVIIFLALWSAVILSRP
jgi:hypothetical protein